MFSSILSGLGNPSGNPQNQGLFSTLPSFNFQSGFGNINDAADSIGSLFGMGPRDRTEVLNESTEQANVVKTDTLNILKNEGKTAALKFLDNFMVIEARSLARMKSANSKASGRQKKQQLDLFRKELVSFDMAKIRTTVNPPELEVVSNSVTNKKQTLTSDKSSSSITALAIGILGFLFITKKIRL